MKSELKPLIWHCRFHPTDWFHEIGCPHQEWTKEQLQSALENKKRFEQENQFRLTPGEWEKGLRQIGESDEK